MAAVGVPIVWAVQHGPRHSGFCDPYELKRLPGMPELVQWMFDVLPKMGNVLLLCGFVFLVFGIIGVELFDGMLHNRCALPDFVPMHEVHGVHVRLHDAATAASSPAITDGTLSAATPVIDGQAAYDTGISCSYAGEYGRCPLGSSAHLRKTLIMASPLSIGSASLP